MFQAVSSPARPRSQQMLTLMLSVAAHVMVLALVVVLPLMYLTDQLPDPPNMMAFVVSAAPPPPPPPPPPPSPQPQRVKPKVEPKPQAESLRPAPVVAPATIEPETLPDVPVQALGGVEGGVPGGIAGGVLGGVPHMPPPPPPPPKPVQPVRVGGDIKEPRLVHRVSPTYPPIAISAKVEGIVILEAAVDDRGAVESVKVLRSVPLLDKAAVKAVKEWRYEPLELNGEATPFILTVTVTFNL